MNSIMVMRDGRPTRMLVRRDQMIERGALVPVALGYQPSDPRSVQTVLRTRDAVPTWRPGTADPRVNTRMAYPAEWATGSTAAPTSMVATLERAFAARGASGSRVQAATATRRMHFAAAKGSRTPMSGTPTGGLMGYLEAVNGSSQRYGSPVTDFSRRVERSRLSGVVAPETGARLVRRNTTQSVSAGSEIVPGQNRRTAGITSVRGAVPALSGTPLLCGVESIVAGTPGPTSGVPLAVGTESFGVATETGGPYAPAMESQEAPYVPPAGGQPIGEAHYRALSPGYRMPAKGGTAMVAAQPQPSSAVTLTKVAAKGGVGLAALGLALVGLAVLSRKKK